VPAVRVQPLPRWAIAFMAVLGLAAAVFVAIVFVDETGDARPAEWRVAPGATLGRDSREVPLLVHERECASGRDASGRIRVDVDYRANTVVLDVEVASLSGGQECPGNPETPYLLELDQPLGERELTGPGMTDGPPS
jgi:hypothetical protein